MKKIKLLMIVTLGTLMITQCTKDEFLQGESDPALKKAGLPDAVPGAMFMVQIENVSTPYPYFAAGAQFIPDGEESPGPAFPGKSFTVEFHAGKGHQLSFASMYGASNDLFYGPDDGGISLFSGSTPLTGNITGLISLWDAGTEVNHAPGSGEDGADESVVIRSLRNTDNVLDGYAYNNVEENISVWLNYDGTSMFTLTINVLENSSTPLSPVAWVVHSSGQNPIFTENDYDMDHGLEQLAETGNAGPLSEYLESESGYVSPVAPGAWVLHKHGMKPIFKEGSTEYGDGLEILSEMGDPSEVYQSLVDQGYEAGVYNTPEGEAGPGPLFPGQTYSFTVEANVGDYLSFASMLGKSNDLFFAPDDMGIRLFKGKTPVNGNITSFIYLWDAGTEVNEYPGAGLNQGPGGTDESGDVLVVNDGLPWPSVHEVIKVTIQPL